MRATADFTRVVYRYQSRWPACAVLRARIAEIAGLKRRYDQLPLDHWSEVIAAPVIADAIRDRLEHSALTLHITGERVGPNSGNRLVPKRQILQQLSAYSLERVTLSMKRSLGK